MNLLDSLLDALIRLDGEALVMHVGEKPYVVTTSEGTNRFRGPLAWGQVELSSRVLTPDAVGGMIGQILPLGERTALEEYGATQYDLGAVSAPAERFTIIAARGGEDVWLEIRRRTKAKAAVAERYAAATPPAAEALSARPAERDSDQQASPALEHVAAGAVAAAHGHHAERPPVDETAPAADLHVEETAYGEARVIEDSSGHASPMQFKDTDFDLPDDGTADAAWLTLDTHDREEEPAASGPAQERPSAGEPTGEDVFGAMQDEESFELPPEFMQEVSAAEVDWAQNVMTEQDVNELLTASAGAVITGDAEFSTAPNTVARLEPQFAGSDIPFPANTVGRDKLASASIEPAAEPPAETAAPSSEIPAAQEEQLRYPGSAAAEPIAEASAPAPMAEAPAVELTVAAAEGEKGYPSLIPETPPHEHEEVTFEPLQAAEAPDTAVARGGTADVPAATRPAAVVVPLSRPTRVEAPQEGRGGGAVAGLQKLLRVASGRGAATVYLVAQSAPILRVDGELEVLEDEGPTAPEFIERLLAELAPRAGDSTAPPAEWRLDVPEVGRVRCVTFRDHRGPGVILRMIPPSAVSADYLGLPPEVQALCTEADGLVLVTGPRGSGKSTLLTSFVDLINRTRSDHIITAEPQVEFVHENKRSFVSQREIRGDAEAVVAAVRLAGREEPDVLVIEDLRTPELVSVALEAAESGRLVFASVPGVSTVAAVERLIELFPAERREKVQASLAAALRGVVSQVLLRRLRGGRVAAREVLLVTPAVANLISEGKTFQLPAALEDGRRSGMVPFAESLAALVREGTVHPSHAYRKAPNREQFLATLRREGIDPSLAERTAS